MSVDGVQKKGKTQRFDKSLLNTEVGKNQPGSPESVKHDERVKLAEGKHTHQKPEKEEKKHAVDPGELAGNAIPPSRFPTGAFD